MQAVRGHRKGTIQLVSEPPDCATRRAAFVALPAVWRFGSALGVVGWMRREISS
jgi:hypothetical protein